MKNKLTLQKRERLKSRKQIEHLFSKGKSFSVFPYRAMYSFSVTSGEAEENTLKAGFAVSSKFFKKAVHRNRVKRITREVYRLQKETLETTICRNKVSLNLFLLFTGKELPPFALAKEKVGVILKKLIQQANEKIIADT